jgi:hypothetical protein
LEKELMPVKKYNYYNVDLGFFPRCVKLCFNNEQFQDILRDQKLESQAITALEMGVAEVHYIGEGKKGIIIAVFNLDDMKDSIEEMIATIAHETVHIIERISDYIEEEEMFTEETRAYLTESIVRQIFKACVIEKEKHARKTLGTILQKLSGESGGSKLQVDQHSDGGARSNSVPKKKNPSRRTKGTNRKAIPKTTSSI